MFPTGLEGLAPRTQPAWFTQGVSEVLDYSIDWSCWLPTGDTITNSVWTSDTCITLGDESFTGTTTTVWVSGGAAHYLYLVFNTITTAGGRVISRPLRFHINGTPAAVGGGWASWRTFRVAA